MLAPISKVPAKEPNHGEHRLLITFTIEPKLVSGITSLTQAGDEWTVHLGDTTRNPRGNRLPVIRRIQHRPCQRGT